MKKRIAISLLAVVLLLVSYAAGYWRGLAQTHSRNRVLVTQDTDVTGASRGRVTTGIDPFFTKGNPISGGAK